MNIHLYKNKYNKLDNNYISLNSEYNELSDTNTILKNKIDNTPVCENNNLSLDFEILQYRY